MKSGRRFWGRHPAPEGRVLRSGPNTFRDTLEYYGAESRQPIERDATTAQGNRELLSAEQAAYELGLASVDCLRERLTPIRGKFSAEAVAEIRAAHANTFGLDFARATKAARALGDAQISEPDAKQAAPAPI